MAHEYFGVDDRIERVTETLADGTALSYTIHHLPGIGQPPEVARAETVVSPDVYAGDITVGALASLDVDPVAA